MEYLLMLAVYVGIVAFFKASLLTSILLGAIFLLLGLLLVIMEGFASMFRR